MPSHRIQIVRLSAVGDVILSVPVACALRRLYPDAHISWIVQHGPATLLEGHPAIDELIKINKLSIRTPSGFSAAIKQARSAKPDITIDIQGLLKTSGLAYFSGASKRIGFSQSEFEGREGSTWLNNVIVQPTEQHVVLRNLELLKPLGLKDLEVEYKFPEFEADLEFAKRIQREQLDDQPYAVINVGAGWESKIWPTDRYAAVADHIYRTHGLKSLIVWGGDKEELLAKEVTNRFPEASVMAPPSSLAQLRSILKHASIFVGSDTGPMHLSAAVGTPTVGMIGPMPGERVGPLGPLHRTVQVERLPIEDRHQRRCDMGPMLSIRVEHVTEAIDSIMSTISEKQTTS